MKISTNSMIYRSYMFHNIGWSDPPTDLCGFVRKYIGRLIITSMFWLCLGLVVTGMIFTAVAYVMSFTGLPFSPYASELIYIGVLGYLVLGGLGAVYIMLKFDEYWKARKKINHASKNIFIEYIRAKKQKICPLIEYVKE